MLAQLIFDIKTIVKDKVYYAVIIVLATLFIMPLLAPKSEFDVGGAFGIERYRFDAQLAQENYFSGANDDTKPEYLKTTDKELHEAYQTIVLDHSTIDQRKQFEAMLRIEELHLESINLGYSPNSDPDSVEERIKLLSLHLEKEIYTIYEISQEMPSINYLAYIFSTQMQAYLFIPIVIIASGLFVSVNRTKSQQFSLSTPLIVAKTNTVHVLAGTTLSMVAVTIAALPASVVCAIKNGIGRTDYPVVSFLPNGLWSGDMAIYIAQYFLLLSTGFLFLASLMLLVSQFVDNRVVVTITAVAFVLASGSGSYFDPQGAMVSIIKWLPTTYFEIPIVIGDTIYAQMPEAIRDTGLTALANPLANTGISLTAGVLAQLSTSIMMFVLATLTPVVLRKLQRVRVTRSV